jgi:uncharacterized protein (TIGR02757 family)
LNPVSPDIKEFLDEKALQYNSPVFIESDPVSIPHGFDRKEDIEIAGFLTATIAWGNRTMILRNGGKLMELMDHAPFDFVQNHIEKDLRRLRGFVHRTFNDTDLVYFIESLRNIYLHHGGLEPVFSCHCTETSTRPAIQEFRNIFFALPHDQRTRKHVASPVEGSAAKRINMFLRWMVRNDNRGVDFGIWKQIKPSSLSCPLDVHSGNVARKLGLLTRNQNDAKALDELDAHLRLMDPADPVKYDFALFGLGVFEGF